MMNTDQDVNYPDPTQSLPSTPADNRRSSGSKVSDRRAMFEKFNNKTTKTTKTTKSNSTKKSTKTQNKPKKKWTVKGIDDKQATKKKAINASSFKYEKVEDDEPSVSMSHKDRMNLYQQDLQNVKEKEKQRMQQHKESRGGYAGVQVLYIFISIFIHSIFLAMLYMHYR